MLSGTDTKHVFVSVSLLLSFVLLLTTSESSLPTQPEQYQSTHAVGNFPTTIHWMTYMIPSLFSLTNLFG